MHTLCRVPQKAVILSKASCHLGHRQRAGNGEDPLLGLPAPRTRMVDDDECFVTRPIMTHATHYNVHATYVFFKGIFFIFVISNAYRVWVRAEGREAASDKLTRRHNGMVGHGRGDPL